MLMHACGKLNKHFAGHWCFSVVYFLIYCLYCFRLVVEVRIVNVIEPVEDLVFPSFGTMQFDGTDWADCDNSITLTGNTVRQLGVDGGLFLHVSCCIIHLTVSLLSMKYTNTNVCRHTDKNVIKMSFK